jgi:shikimate kinase
MIVYLNADRKVLYQRLKNSRNRPLLDKDNLWDNINKTMDFREELYKKSCDYEVDIAWENAYEVAEKIKKLYIEKG